MQSWTASLFICLLALLATTCSAFSTSAPAMRLFNKAPMSLSASSAPRRASVGQSGVSGTRMVIY